MPPITFHLKREKKSPTRCKNESCNTIKKRRHVMVKYAFISHFFCDSGFLGFPDFLYIR